MTYEEWRVAAVREIYANTIKDLVGKKYRKDRPTVVLLPGGMGSELRRSDMRYEGQSEMPKRDEYNTVWIDGGILGKDALKLKIDDQGRDVGQHAIVADGPLHLPLVRTPYNGTEKFFKKEGWNFITFGYDWRRPLREAADNLRTFLAAFRDAVKERHGENPLPQTHLYAHSQGGLVLKLFLNGITDDQGWFGKAFTVATPFYGTSTHQNRYFRGIDLLNEKHKPVTVVDIVGSLPGPYSLMFLPKPIFDRYGAAIGLDQYPLTEPGTGRTLDPYDPANLERYLPAVNAAFLEEARQVYDEIAAPLPQGLAMRFVNIRGSEKSTVTSLTWKPLPEGYEPGDESPLEEDRRGVGDGTVPSWSAWHAGTPGNNVYDPGVKEHEKLAENRKVLKIVERLIKGDEPGSLAVAEAVDATPDELYGGPEDLATLEEVEAFMSARRQGLIDDADPRANDPRIWRRIIREMMTLR